jgi:putative transposase
MILLTLNFTNMRRKFSESQIVAAIKKQESGIPVKEICREIGISDATFYNWKAKYGGMEVSEVARIRELEKENAELKKMFAEMSLENRAMKLLIEKKL